MSDLTPRQANVLRFIQRSLSETGMPPTRAEIAAELGFRSPNAAEEHLRALARKGVIQLLPGASRGIQLRDTMREQLTLPLVGRVAGDVGARCVEHPGAADHGRLFQDILSLNRASPRHPPVYLTAVKRAHRRRE